MHESQTLITTIVASLVGAFIFGFISKKLKQPAILGYLLAGILIGPHTPGINADQHIASQLSEIGIILLMFGVGLHISLESLLSVRRIVVPGVLVQGVVISSLGFALASFLGFRSIEAIMFGFSLSVASTVVLMRTLEQRVAVNTPHGRIATGWLIVEDMVIVLALVLLPVLAGIANNDAPIDWGKTSLEILLVFGKISLFAFIMIIFGKRYLPSLLVMIARTKSREMMTLGTIAIALGFAYLAFVYFGASLALGAFFAGLVLNESEIGHKAGEQTLPLRDIFTILFFVSAGMLFNPGILLSHPLAVIAVVAIIMLGKSAVAFTVNRLFKQPAGTSILIGASVAQIGEFSFVLAGLAQSLNVMPEMLHDLVLAGAILSIALNPFWFSFAENWATRHTLIGKQ